MSQELTENIISKLENPQLVNERGIFKFNTEELNNIKVDLMKKIHKHVCLTKILLPFLNRLKISYKNENTTFRITFFFHIAQCSKHIYCVA
jgi:hypothetical protein